MPDRTGTPLAHHPLGEPPADLESTTRPWHGSATDDVTRWRSRALAAETELATLRAQLDGLRAIVRALKGGR